MRATAPFAKAIETLESRMLLSATVSSAIPAQAITAGTAPTVVTLGTYFNDSVIPAGDTLLEIQTNLPSPNNVLPVELTTAATPLTVANFLRYINSGEYANTIIHRSATVPDANGTQFPFVVQGGGYAASNLTNHINTFGTVQGEAATATLKNTTGTIAMALSTGPNSGTSEWFINLINNNSATQTTDATGKLTGSGANLDDTSHGGPFTAFGQVIYNGLATAEAIAGLPTVNDTANGALTNLPLQNYTGTSGSMVTSVAAADLVTTNPVVANDDGLTFAATSSNTGLVTAAVANGSLTLTPVTGATGTANITVTATDLGGGTTSSTFALTVNPSATPTPTPTPTPVPTVGLVPKVLKSTVSTAVVAGTNVRGAVTVTLTNNTTTVDRGTNTVRLYAVPAGVTDPTLGALISTAPRKLNLAAGKSVHLALRVMPTALPTASYTLIAQATNAANAVVAATTGPALAVSAPDVTLAATVGAVAPATVVAGRPVSFTVAVTNTGNVTAAGFLLASITFTPADGKNATVTLIPVQRRATFKPNGRPVALRFRVSLPAGTGAGTYVPHVTIDQGIATGTATASAVGTTPFTVTAG